MNYLSRGALVLLAAGAAAAATTSVTPAGAARTKTVSLEDIDYTPRTATIQRGDTIRWVWKDDPTPHNVRSRGAKRFKSSGVKTTGSHVVRFTKRGTYRYVCTIHIGMDGRIVVR